MSLHELVNATNSLKTSLALFNKTNQKEPNNSELHKALRDSCIQRFEFCIELSWKTSVRLLGLQTRAPNTAIREMAQNNLIADTLPWFEFLDARNRTSRT